MFEAEVAELAARYDLSHDAAAALIAVVCRAHQASPPAVLSTAFGTNPGVALDANPTLVADEDGEPMLSSGRGQVTSRYDDLGPLGAGAVGEVRRVRDRDLNRIVAMKILRKRHLPKPSAVARFVEEAQATGQLQHPGIVPVHDLGRLPDGRLYFTMNEIRGRTLADVIREVHSASSPAGWATGATGWTFRRLLDALRDVCEAVGYAHQRGVIHRDLKPQNVMVGAWGQVLVVDWGIAKILGRRAPLERQATEEADIVTDRSMNDAQATRDGAVAGTPTYMSPEQARGEIDRLDARTDVYALGALLYELLAGRTPYQHGLGWDVVEQVLAGPPQPLAEVEPEDSLHPARPPTPPELIEICDRAMAREPSDRFENAGELAAELSAWLDGQRKRQRALAVVASARAKTPEAKALRRRAASLRADAAEALRNIPDWAPEDLKAVGWAMDDQALAMETAARLADLESRALLHGALTHVPDLPEAHAGLADRYRADHSAAEANGDVDAAARAEVMLRTHVSALPAGHTSRRRHRAYLEGNGALTLRTDVPAEVLLHRYEARNRRWVPRFERSLGTTPLEDVALPMGTFVAVLRSEGRQDVPYPILVRRREHWNGIPPGASTTRPIALPQPDAIGDDCYVPAGWFTFGEVSGDSLPLSRVWLDGFMMQRFQITNREYMVFLDDLVASGREDEALRHVPRERPGTRQERGPMIYGTDDEGRFILRADAEGDLWGPDWPVLMIDWLGASAYARWRAARDGLPWRLPSELEWEKSARGVDGRIFPWGPTLDPSWCAMRESHAGRRLPSPVDSYPVDTSVYGVRGLGGNARDWCADHFSKRGPRVSPTGFGLPAQQPSLDASDDDDRVVARGGYWAGFPHNARSTFRYGTEISNRLSTLGFRLVRTWP